MVSISTLREFIVRIAVPKRVVDIFLGRQESAKAVRSIIFNFSKQCCGRLSAIIAIQLLTSYQNRCTFLFYNVVLSHIPFLQSFNVSYISFWTFSLNYNTQFTYRNISYAAGATKRNKYSISAETTSTLIDFITQHLSR